MTIRAYHHTLSRLSRRQLLNAAWKLGAAAVAQPLLSSYVQAQPLFREYPFPLGVASGDPLPDGVVLWTRLAPQPLEGGGMPMVNVSVGWEIAADAQFRSVVQKGSVLARPELGHSVHAEVTGLIPGREYWYRFVAGGEVSQAGRTKTAPLPGAPVDRLRFAVCGCSQYEQGYFTALRHLAAETFDFVFHTGDYIYESRADGGRNARVRQHHGAEIYSLSDYRTRYAQYKMDPDLRLAHASAPFVVTWDDHEVDNNYAGNVDQDGTPPEVFLLRRAAAYQAYYEMMPLRRSAMPAGPNMRLYRRLQFGNLLDLSALDTRQYRDDQACNDGFRTGCADALRDDRTMLGAEQERWLFDHMGRVSARWTVLGQQVPSFAEDRVTFEPSARLPMDKWDGYAADRRRVYQRLHDANVPNPIVLSGDVHQHYAADLKLDFANPKSPTVGVELTNSAITSGGDGSDVSATWEQLRAGSPHIRYHSNRRGYIACTATQAAMQADFRVVDRVTTPDAPVRTAGTMVVEAGRPGLSL